VLPKSFLSVMVGRVPTARENLIALLNETARANRSGRDDDFVEVKDLGFRLERLGNNSKSQFSVYHPTGSTFQTSALISHEKGLNGTPQ
jgi:hypothetical protein